MNIVPVRTNIFREGGSLEEFITQHVKELPNGSILVVSSKIVALAEGRVAPAKDRDRLIKKESTRAVKTQQTWLTEKDGVLMPSAGIDESNGDGKLALLPKDSFQSARNIHSKVLKNFRIKKVGVIIADSRIYPLRAGVTGVALGYAGFKGLRDYRGKKDLFGRTLRMTQTNLADSLATAATLVMGEGKERQPLAVITGAPVEFSNHTSRRELIMDEKGDMFEPLLRHFKKPALRSGRKKK